MLAVYEALSHKSRAHYSYLLVVNFPDTLNNDQKAEFDAVLAVAGNHGIGVITSLDENNWSTWNFELDATRSNADHQAINQMLLDQVPKDVRDPFRGCTSTDRCESVVLNFVLAATFRLNSSSPASINQLHPGNADLGIFDGQIAGDGVCIDVILQGLGDVAEQSPRRQNARQDQTGCPFHKCRSRTDQDDRLLDQMNNRTHQQR